MTRHTALRVSNKTTKNLLLRRNPQSDFHQGRKAPLYDGYSRIYDDASKGKAKEAEIELFSMDDPNIYGDELHRFDFSEAVRRDLLSDYKVMVLAVDEKFVNQAFQQQLADDNNELNLDDVVKIVGCYNGLENERLSPMATVRND